MGIGSHHCHGRAEAVWLTPPHIVEALGPFDLDPCFGSPRPWDTAADHYGPDAAGGLGGLACEWHGLVWCNPPYDRKAEEWLKRCVEHGNAIALIFARAETSEFHRWVWQRADAVFFPEGRFHFHHPDGERAKHNGGAPSVLVGYGETATARLESAHAAMAIKGRLVRL